MDFPAFLTSIKGKRAFAPVYLFFGTETLLQTQGLQALRDADESFKENTVPFTAPGIHWSDLIAELTTVPMTGRRKFVTVADDGTWIKGEADNLKAYLSAPSSSAVLAILSPNTTAPLSTTSKNLVAIACRALEPADVRRWVEQTCKARGGAISSEAAARLVARTGTNLLVLDNALQQLLLYAKPGAPLRVSDIDLLITDRSGSEVYELIQAVCSRSMPDALRLLHRLLNGGETPIAIISRLAWQYRKMTDAKHLLKQGVRRTDVLTRLEIRYYAERFLALVESHSIEQLHAGLQTLMETDLALKSSSRDSEEALMERLIAQLSLDSRTRGREDQGHVRRVAAVPS